MNDQIDELIETELRYAHFNALRTCTGDNQDGMTLSLAESLPHLLDPGRPTSTYYNRCIIPPGLESIDDALANLPSAIAGIELQSVQQTPANLASLHAAGFVADCSLCYLHADPAERKPVSADGEVVQLGHDQTEEFFDLLSLSGVEFSPDKRAAKHEYYCNDQFRCFAAYTTTGNPAALATMYVDGNAGFLANAFTLPQYRRRGYQAALLSFRMSLASKLNLCSVYTDVQPISQSHANCIKAGFQFLNSSVIWKRKATDKQ